MQLRVARLCLDCEELHTGEICPICASERFAFLSTWLPVDERRRWRRSSRTASDARAEPSTPARSFVNVMRGWLGLKPSGTPSGPRTRAADQVPRLEFEPAVKPQPAAAPTLDPQPAQARDQRS
jgi:hypothetical protein